VTSGCRSTSACNVVYQVGEAPRRELPTERLYVMSLGSQSGNRHVHWHLAPLPLGVPYERQQLAAFSWEHGVLDLPDEDLPALAARIGAATSSPAAATSTRRTPTTRQRTPATQ
jgi:diadenosine tetraphosphate (Ap4A) HIT family hydrolase